MQQHMDIAMQQNVEMKQPQQIQIGAEQEQLMYLQQQHEEQQRQIAELRQQLMQQHQLNLFRDQGVAAGALHEQIEDMQHMQVQDHEQNFGQLERFPDG